MLDDERTVWSVLNKALGRSGMQVTIGSENLHEGFQDCSLVTATYELNGEVVGSIGGWPTRMGLREGGGIVEGMASPLSSLLSDSRRH